MSKGYAIAFIFTTLSVFGSLFYLQHQVLTERHAATFAYAEGVNERVIAQKREHLDDEVYRLQEKLNDETKYRFRPIGAFLEEVREREEEFIKLAETNRDFQKDQVPILLALREAHLEELMLGLTNLLKNHGKEMDLRPADIKTLSQDYEERVNEVKQQPIPAISTKTYSLQRDFLLLDYLNAVESILLRVVQIAGGKTIECGGYFPVMSTDIVNPRKGETVRAKVSIGSYSSSLNPNHIVLTAGKDTLRMNPDGTADYQFTPSKRGVHTVDLSFKILHPLTGEVMSGDGSYTYNVY